MPYSPKFEQALQYASRLHAAQCRKSTEIPYITHLMSVAGIVADYGGEEDQVIAALLHDAVEDQGGAPRLLEIRELFGTTVSSIVADCTDADVTPKPPWRSRKEAYVRHLAQVDSRSLLVSAADKLHNARTIVEDLRRQGAATFDKFRGGRDGTLWYYRSISSVLDSRGDHPLFQELGRVVSTMLELAAASQ